MSHHFSDDLLGIAIEAAEHAAGLLRQMQGSIETVEVSEKANNREVVTAADLEAEQRIIEILMKGPSASFITEETSPQVSLGEGLFWIVDPLDGSSAYSHGLDTYSVSIAAWYMQRPLVGVVGFPAASTIYTATEGGGARGPSGPLQVSDREERSAIVSFGASVVRKAMAGTWPNADEITNSMTRAQGLRVAASCAQDMVLVASGRVESYMASLQHIWDYAAGMLLVREAGGRLWLGREADSGRRDILATNGRITSFQQHAANMIETSDVK